MGSFQFASNFKSYSILQAVEEKVKVDTTYEQLFAPGNEVQIVDVNVDLFKKKNPVWHSAHSRPIQATR